MNVLYGLHQPDAGEVLIDDEPVTFSGPGDAVAAGIGMVHQHFMLVPVFTVAESVALGYEPVGSLGAYQHRCRRVRSPRSPPLRLRRGNPTPHRGPARGKSSSVGSSRPWPGTPKVLILDEPTAVLTRRRPTAHHHHASSRPRTSSSSSPTSCARSRVVADTITVIRRGLRRPAPPSPPPRPPARQPHGRPRRLLDRRQAPGRPAGSGLATEGISLIEDGTATP